MTPTVQPTAYADACTQALIAAERFVAGFEDDASQPGVDSLLQQLRAATASSATQIVLQPVGGGKAEFHSALKGATVAMVITGPAFETRLYKSYGPDSEGEFFSTGKWWGSQERRDQHGKTWRQACELVCDDFGDLVEVTQ